MPDQNYKVGKYTIIDTDDIGEGTRIWNYVNILNGVSIGANCNICDRCYIEQGVSIGNNVTIKNGVSLWEGLIVEDDVFIGPDAVFTNDRYPKSRKPFKLEKTVLGKGCTIGAGAVILCGIEIGAGALIGAGAVVTKSVPARALCYGFPAKIYGELDENRKIIKKYEKPQILK